jgi:signal transduction histidine kinase
LGIVNDILDFSKIEAGKLDLLLEPVDLIKLLDGVMDMVAPAAQAKGLNFGYFIDPKLPARFSTDPVRLRQVLINLLGNAIKFTQQGYVYLNVVKAAHCAHHLCFEVVDTGLGISQEGQSKLFSAFSQVDGSSSRGFGGTGLGLVISRQLVALLGGEIAVKSTLGEGSCFYF